MTADIIFNMSNQSTSLLLPPIQTVPLHQSLLLVDNNDSTSIVSFEIDDIVNEEEMEIEFDISSAILTEPCSDEPPTLMHLMTDNLRNYSSDSSSVCSDITAGTNEHTRLDRSDGVVNFEQRDGPISMEGMMPMSVCVPQEKNWQSLPFHDESGISLDQMLPYEGRQQFFFVGDQFPSQNYQQQQQHVIPSYGIHHAIEPRPIIQMPHIERSSVTWPCVQELLGTIVSDDDDFDDDDDDASFEYILE